MCSCFSWVGEGEPGELTPYLSMGKDPGHEWDGWLVDTGLLKHFACRRAWSAARWDFSVTCFVFPFCTGLQQAAACGLTGLALLLCACCVPVSSLLVWAGKKSPGALAKSILLDRGQIMSWLDPGTRGSREWPRWGGVTGLSFDRQLNWSHKAKGGGWIYSDLQSKTSASSQDAYVGKVLLLCCSWNTVVMHMSGELN